MQAAVLGNAGCGKTSLIRALVGLPFDADSPPTEKRTSFRSPLIGKDSMFIDCGHIEDEEALRNLLLGSKVNCVILCYDCSNPSSLHAIQTDWLDAVLACKLKLFLIMVGLKSELRHGVDNAQVLDFANERNLFSLQVSAKLGENVGLLLEVLQQRVPSTAMAKPPAATTLQFHRSGSVDLTSPALNLHLSSDGQVKQQQQQPAMFPLYVDVRTGNVSGTIAVRSAHDDALQLARQFLLQHGLDANRATDLAKIIQARLAEFFVQRRPTTPGLLPSSAAAATPSKRILARLSVVVNAHVTAVVVVREDDDATRVVDAFRRTYDLRKDDLVVEELYDRVQMALQRGVVDDEEEDLRQLLLEDGSKQEKNGSHRRRKDRAPSASSDSSSSSEEEEVVVVERKRKKKKRPVERKSFDDDDDKEEEQPRRPKEQTRRRRRASSASSAEEQDMLVEELRRSSFEQPRPPRRVSIQNEENTISSLRRNSSRQDPARSPIVSPANRKQQQQEEVEEDMMSVFEEDEYNDVVSHERRAPPPPPPSSRRNSSEIPRPFLSGRSVIASTSTLRRMPGAPPPPPPSRYSAAPPPPASRYATPNNMPRYLASTAASRSFSSVPPQAPATTRPVLFYVDVNLGGKTERIAVCKNDNLQHLAEKFLEDHRLPKTKLGKLTQLLDVHLKQHQRNRRTML